MGADRRATLAQGSLKLKSSVTLAIGGLARAAEVNVETVRFYHRRGLLPLPGRAHGSSCSNCESCSDLRFELIPTILTPVRVIIEGAQRPPRGRGALSFRAGYPPGVDYGSVWERT